MKETFFKELASYTVVIPRTELDQFGRLIIGEWLNYKLREEELLRLEPRTPITKELVRMTRRELRGIEEFAKSAQRWLGLPLSGITRVKN